MEPKAKLRLTFLSIPILMLLCYYLAINKTFEQHKEYNQLRSQAEQFDNIPSMLRAMTLKESQLDSSLLSLNLEDTSIDNNLIRVLNQSAHNNNIQVLEYSAPHRVQVEEGTMATYDFTLSGDFNGILKTIYALESKHNFGQIIHCDLKKSSKRRRSIDARILVLRYL